MWPPNIVVSIITTLLIHMWASSATVAAEQFQLLLISDDVYQMATFFGGGNSDSGGRIPLAYLIRNHRLLVIPSELERTIAKCVYGSKSNDLFRGECYSTSTEARVAATRLNATISIDRMNELCRSIKIASRQRIQLSSVLVVANARIISLFRLLCFDLQVSIYAVDVLKMSTVISRAHFDENQNNYQVNRTTAHVFLDIADHFRSIEQLENVNIYASSSYDKNLFRHLVATTASSTSRRRRRLIRTVSSTKDLLNNLRKLIIYDHYAGTSAAAAATVFSMAAVTSEKYGIYEQHHSSTGSASRISRRKQDLITRRMIGFERALDFLAASFLNKNDLIIIKSDVDTLAAILDSYAAIRRKHLFMPSSSSSSSHLINRLLYENKRRRLIWIPEMTTNQRINSYLNNHSMSFVDMTRILLEKSNLCSLNLFVFNTLLSLDRLLSATSASTSLSAASATATFSLKSVTSFFSTTSSTNRTLKSDQYEFKVLKESDELLIQDPTVYVENGDFAYVKLDDHDWRHQQQKQHQPKKSSAHKPVYRIVSNQIEPFVIVSWLEDENLQNQTDCNDGLPCLVLDTNQEMSFTGSFEALLNKEFFIDLIMNYRWRTNEEIKKIKHMKVRTRCCTGYLINLLQRLSADLQFDFEFYIVPRRQFGTYNETSGAWSGTLNHVVNGVAHLLAGPFSITRERARYIDFSTPFLYSGYALLIKQEKKGVDDLFMFMRPFSYLHWALIALFAFGMAVSLALLEFNSPFGLNPMGRQRARNYTLGSAISMVISLMFMHTMPAKSPKSWAGKWTQNFIASFALIFIATYTAQMASILSAGQDSKAFRGIDDTELLNLKRGYLKESSIESQMCFKSKDYYKSHCQNSLLLKNDLEGVQSVINGTLDVYMSDNILLNYLRFIQTDCNIKTTGDEFATTGYALGMSKELSNEEKNDINIQILEYYEIGYLDELYSKWFNKRVKCNRKGSDDKIRIDVDQYKGVYLYLGLGIIAAILVLLLEHYLYKWTIPFLRSKPHKSNWKSLKLMFISQRFYRIVHSEEYYDASHSAKEFINVFRRRDFEAIFQKSFRKKQMESLHGSQLRKRPKLWALIEASTERKSRDLINRSSSSDYVGEDGRPIREAAAAATNLPTEHKGLLKLPVSLSKKSSNEHLKELAAIESQHRKQRQQQQHQQQQQQETSFVNSENKSSASPSLLTTPTVTVPPPLRTDNKLKMLTLTPTPTSETAATTPTTMTKPEGEYDQVLIPKQQQQQQTKRRTLMPVLKRELSTTSSQLESSCTELYADCELLAFTLDVPATPALEEPEVCDISGSSISLAVQQQPPQDTTNTNTKYTSDETTAAAATTGQNKLREYKLIHSMFARKSRLDKK